MNFYQHPVLLACFYVLPMVVALSSLCGSFIGPQCPAAIIQETETGLELSRDLNKSVCMNEGCSRVEVRSCIGGTRSARQILGMPHFLNFQLMLTLHVCLTLAAPASKDFKSQLAAAYKEAGKPGIIVLSAKVANQQRHLPFWTAKANTFSSMEGAWEHSRLHSTFSALAFKRLFSCK